MYCAPVILKQPNKSIHKSQKQLKNTHNVYEIVLDSILSFKKYKLVEVLKKFVYKSFVRKRRRRQKMSKLDDPIVHEVF